MRSIWKGAVSFGLVSIGVKLYSATEEKSVSFNQVRRSDASRIRYKRVAEADGEEVPYPEIAKGYQLPDGETVVLSDEDFADLPLTSNKVVDVVQFVPAEQIDPIYFSKSYYLEPDKAAVKPYVLLREALESSRMVGLVKVALRNREQLATLRVREGVIVLETMLWPDEIRQPDFAFLDQDVELRPPERSMAESLVTSMAGDFEPDAFHDEYREALEKVIEAKIQGRQVVEAPGAARADTGNVVDLMAALRASVEAAKAKRGDGSQPPPVDDADETDQRSGAEADQPSDTQVAEPDAEKPAARKPAARKTTARKTAGKKTAAGKAPASKPSASKDGGTASAKPAKATKAESATKGGTKGTAKTATSRRRSA